MVPSSNPLLYHITHVDNLASILRDGRIYSEAAIKGRGVPAATVGMGHIKTRRLEIPIHCHPGTTVGEYVPFYFCPRSVMLYLLYRGNHPELAYHGGQESILHLEFDFDALVSWADAQGKAWAISPTNAGAFYTQFYTSRSALGRIDWAAVAAEDWRQSEVREHKQAEFLLHESVLWTLVKRIGVHDKAIQEKVVYLLGKGANPVVEVRPEWYY